VLEFFADIDWSDVIQAGIDTLIKLVLVAEPYRRCWASTLGLASSDLTGQPQLVNVFASWCASCRVEQGLLVELARQTKIPINGLNWKDKPEDAVAWLKQYGNPFSRIGSDLSGRVAIDWGVYGAPETYVIDAQGRIRYRHVGPLTPQDVQQKLLPLIQQLKG